MANFKKSLIVFRLVNLPDKELFSIRYNFELKILKIYKILTIKDYNCEMQIQRVVFLS